MTDKKPKKLSTTERLARAERLLGKSMIYVGILYDVVTKGRASVPQTFIAQSLAQDLHEVEEVLGVKLQVPDESPILKA